jgi:aminoglycoside phosphotransferase (APT) family kinase protein
MGALPEEELVLSHSPVRTNRNVIEVDDRVVRRFPVTAADRADLPDIAARHTAARALGLPVPRVLGVHSDHLVLERMPGTALIVTELTAPAQRTLGTQLARALEVLRRTSSWPLPARDWAHLWEDLAVHAATPATRRAADVARTVRTTVVHGDLSGGNLLVTPDGTLTAILDWDGATLGDPSLDFTALCANVPARVAAAVRAATLTADEMDERARVYLATWADQDRLWRASRHPWIS